MTSVTFVEFVYTYQPYRFLLLAWQQAIHMGGTRLDTYSDGPKMPWVGGDAGIDRANMLPKLCPDPR
jgi:hypothetical protein